MLKIEITEDAADKTDMVELLRRIADLVEEGYTSGNYPDWKLTGEADPAAQLSEG